MSILPLKKKLPAKYNAIAFPFVLSLVMSSIISFVATSRTVGFIDGLIGIWLHAWAFSWCIAFPTVLMVMPPVRRFVGLFVEKPGH